MKKGRIIYLFCFVLALGFLQGCIHDYPKPVRGPGGKGEDPTKLWAQIEVSFDLKWESMIHQADISTKTKGRDEEPHRFVIEVINRDGKVVCQDTKFITSNEFSFGKISHKLTANLEADKYRVAVWYDMQDEEGEYPFDAENLNEVKLSNFSTRDAEVLQCGFASDFLDLTDVEFSDKEITVAKELELQHPGARFEIVATDIQQFIAGHHEAMMKGDSYTVHLCFTSGTPVGYNLHSGNLYFGIEKNLELSGIMRLPFADYDELKIAEGFLFCNEERDVTLNLGVKNSALVTISKTELFSFPIKPGYITIIRGDFLSSPIEGIFSVDNIWEDEIVMEI